jgi:hypothetical protein
MNDSSTEAGSVSTGLVQPTQPGPEIQRLEVFIGRWLTEGHLVGEGDARGSRIVASDIYEWGPGGIFVVHPAYGRIEDVAVGGLEVIRFDPSTGAYATHFFDNQGNVDEQTLTPDGDTWLWQGEHARCTGVFDDGGRTLAAHHERRTEDGAWVPSMEVILTRIG